MEILKSSDAPRSEEVPHIFDTGEANEYIEAMLEKGELPVVTIPKRYAESLSRGLRPNSTWIPELAIISGVLGRAPYLPNEEPRVTVKVHVSKDRIHPRLTGPDHSFQGVVVIDGPVAPEEVELVV